MGILRRRRERAERARRRAEFRDLVLNAYIVEYVKGDGRSVRMFFDLRKNEIVRDGQGGVSIWMKSDPLYRLWGDA